MSGKPVEFHPEALAEAEAALAWYEERSGRAAAVFVGELEKGIQAISEAPHRWPQYERECRRYPLVRLPYILVFRETAASVQVIAVAHGRRRPGYWRTRITE